MTNTSPVETWLTYMDGVLVHEETPLPGAADFLAKSGNKLHLLVNNAAIMMTPQGRTARANTPAARVSTARRRLARTRRRRSPTRAR